MTSVENSVPDERPARAERSPNPANRAHLQGFVSKFCVYQYDTTRSCCVQKYNHVDEIVDALTPFVEVAKGLLQKPVIEDAELMRLKMAIGREVDSLLTEVKINYDPRKAREHLDVTEALISMGNLLVL